MNLNKNNIKMHYKMYKSGKKWIISGITTAAILITVSDFNLFDKASADTKTNLTTSINDDVNKNPNNSTNSAQSSSSAEASKVTSSSSSDSVQSLSSTEDNQSTTSASDSSTQSSSSAENNQSINSASNSSAQSSSSAENNKSTTSASNSSAQSSSSAEDNKSTSASNSSVQSSSSVEDNQSTTSASNSSARSSASAVDNNSLASSSNSANSSSLSDSNSSSSTKSLSSELNGIAILPTGGNYETTDGGKTYKYVYQDSPLKGLYNDNGKLVYFDGYDGTQARGAIYNINNVNYVFDKSDGSGTKIAEISGGQYRQATASDGQNSIPGAWVYQQTNNLFAKGIQSVDGNLRYFDTETGSQLKGGTAEINGANYYFEPSQGDLIGNVDQIVNNGKYVDNNGATQYVDSNNNAVKGLTSVNNNLQYFDVNTGNQVKNQQVYTNGVTYYFDNSGNGQYLFTNTGNSIQTETSQHNVANSTDPSDYKNTVDGFLTADSWYRPKDILDSGTTWRTSNSSDYRPIITTWWPNKDIEVNYLKLMQDNGLLSTDVKYNRFSDQTILDQAAQTAQASIESRIKQENSTDWLNNLLFQGSANNPSFMNKQYIWNINSESQWQGDAWFQGGYLKYQNSDLTPTTNSNYRNPDNYFDFLLANDVDNSNPVVQAEDLNWLHYLMNFGSITTDGKDTDSNFDSVRLDAVDFISNDIIQRTYDYLRDVYKLADNEANANGHISLVEAGADAGTTTYGSNALIETSFRELAQSSLTNGPGKNTSLANLIKEMDSGVVIADHSNYSSDAGIPNYSIIHAHDKGIQERIGAAITDATGADWTNFTADQLKTGLAAYYNDQRSVNKKYNSYNLPSAYAIMLTNKGTVPRIYYGDMYQDDGQYMQNQSIYYDAITSLMKARKQYVSGGQTMSVDDNGLLKSVRFGNGAMTAADTGTQETRTEGIGLIVGNDPSINLKDGDTVTLNMGAAHTNQAYRALMLTTKDGIQTYDSDANAPVVYTDNNGNLTFSNQDINNQANTGIKGTLNPQVSGYLAAWVPVGASADQDARTSPSTTQNTDGNVLHSNPALDSNLIYEGFSNFQPMPTSHDEMTNVVITKNADLFKQWGVTSFEMAPQYKSTNDNTFLDSTVQNGYAFSDRYDLGLSSATKYGTADDLRNAIKALHQSGMQVMADLVLNQVYNLPGKQVVAANRAGVYGNDVSVPFGTQLYVTNTIGGGQYQQQYGGEFLKELQAKYPDLFNAKTYNYYLKNYADNGKGPTYLSTLSATRDAIPSDQALKQWSAKYMNGTNILGRGMGYVLKDWNTGKYFKVDGSNTVLPTALTSSLIYRHGWAENGDGTWSYYGQDNGNRLLGNQVIDGQHVFFNTNGVQVKGDWGENPDGTWSYFDANSGDRLTGSQNINGQYVYFNSNGIQVKGDWVTNPDGTRSYYDANSGERLTRNQTIDGKHVFFNDSGRQVKNDWGENTDGTWSYFDDNGEMVTGSQLINGQHVYFNTNGIQVKGNWVTNSDGSRSYYDANSGNRLTGEQYINGQHLYFDDNGNQVKGKTINVNGVVYDADNDGLLTLHSDSASSSASASASSSNATSSLANSSASSSSSTSAVTSNSASTSNSSSSDFSNNSAELSSVISSVLNSAFSNSSSGTSNSSSASSSASSSYVNSSSSSSFTVSSSASYINTNTSTTASTMLYYYEASSSSSTTNGSSSAASSISSSSSTNTSASSSVISSSTNSISSASAITSSNSSDNSNVANEAKIAFASAYANVKIAKKKLNVKKTKHNLSNYNQALSAYYRAEKNYLVSTKHYSHRYYYDFDQVNKHSKFIRTSKLTYVYGSERFTKQNRIYKLKKGTKIKVQKIVVHGKTTRIKMGDHQFITGLKSFIYKLDK